MKFEVQILGPMRKLIPLLNLLLIQKSYFGEPGLQTSPALMKVDSASK